MTGKHAFPGTANRGTLHAIRRGDFKKPREVSSSVPEALESISLRALATDPYDRYQTATELHDALELFARSTGRPSRPGAIAAHVHSLFGDPEEQEPGLDDDGPTIQESIEELEFLKPLLVDNEHD